MAVTERSLANLRPAWSSETAPRNGGAWPAWRRALREQIGGGEELFGALAKLARGEAIAVVGPDGRPLIEPETGRPVVLVPSSAVVLGAIRELLDRAFGKPATLEEEPEIANDDAAARQVVSSLRPDEVAAIQAISRRLMLATGATSDSRPSGDATGTPR